MKIKTLLTVCLLLIFFNIEESKSKEIVNNSIEMVITTDVEPLVSVNYTIPTFHVNGCDLVYQVLNTEAINVRQEIIIINKKLFVFTISNNNKPYLNYINNVNNFNSIYSGIIHSTGFI